MKTNDYLVHTCKMLMLASFACLHACTAPTSVSNSDALALRIGGDDYLITQLTASTWSATAAKQGKPLLDGVKRKSELTKAIELTSGCKVSDSYFSRNDLQFDAQVDCGNTLKN